MDPATLAALSGGFSALESVSQPSTATSSTGAVSLGGINFGTSGNSMALMMAAVAIGFVLILKK